MRCEQLVATLLWVALPEYTGQKFVGKPECLGHFLIDCVLASGAKRHYSSLIHPDFHVIAHVHPGRYRLLD